MNKYVITIDPQPCLTALCIRNVTYPEIPWKVCKITFVTGTQNKNTRLCALLNHHTKVVKDHLDEVFSPEVLGFDDYENIETVYVEGQFKGKAMICLEAFMKGYITTRFENAKCHSLSAREWKKILPTIARGKSYYEDEIWNEYVLPNCEILDLTTGSLAGRNHDIVDAFLMMQYTLTKKK